MVQSRLPLDRTFGALADPTRRDILVRLGPGPMTLSELAEPYAMSLTGLKKHVQILEDARLVTTVKQGRFRTCALGPDRLDDATKWIGSYRDLLEQRLDGLEAFLADERRASSDITEPNG